MTNAQVLLLIAAFVLLTFGSFIWYVATWNKDAATDAGPVSAPAVQRVVL